MRNDDKDMRHAMMSFALMGGMLVSSKPKATRVESRPQDFKPAKKKLF